MRILIKLTFNRWEHPYSRSWLLIGIPGLQEDIIVATDLDKAVSNVRRKRNRKRLFLLHVRFRQSEFSQKIVFNFLCNTLWKWYIRPFFCFLFKNKSKWTMNDSDNTQNQTLDYNAHHCHNTKSIPSVFYILWMISSLLVAFILHKTHGR